MPKAKVRPIITFNWPDHNTKSNNNNIIIHRSESMRLTDKWEDNYGSGNRHDRHYWHARREFLKSYHFSSEQNNESGTFKVKEKLRRSVKEMNEAAMGVFSDIRKEMSKRRVGFRVLKIKFALSSLGFISIRCFTPCLHNTDGSLMNFSDDHLQEISGKG